MFFDVQKLPLAVGIFIVSLAGHSYLPAMRGASRPLRQPWATCFEALCMRCKLRIHFLAVLGSMHAACRGLLDRFRLENGADRDELGVRELLRRSARFLHPHHLQEQTTPVEECLQTRDAKFKSATATLPDSATECDARLQLRRQPCTLERQSQTLCTRATSSSSAHRRKASAALLRVLTRSAKH